MNQTARMLTEVTGPNDAAAKQRLQAARETFELIQHKISQPLTSVRCCLELLAKSAPHEKERHYLKWARRENERVAQLLRDVGVGIRCAEARAQEETVTLGEELALCAQDLDVVATSLGVTLLVSTLDDIRVVAPKSVIKEALTGVIDEAIQRASKDERRTVEAKLTRAGHSIRLIVHCGGSSKGVSAGLWYADRACEELGGRLSMTQGEFVLELPMKKTQPIRPPQDVLRVGGQR